MPKPSITRLPHHQQEHSASCVPALSKAEGAACVVIVHNPVLPEGPIEIPWAEFKDAWRYSRHMMATVEPREVS